MGFLYVNENGATIGVEANQCTVNYKDGMKRLIPIESLDGITIMGRSQNDNSVRGRMYEQRDSGKLFFKGWKIFWPVDFNRTC